ncbi:MAG: hypothetical protein AAF970_06220 [Bacteroidota bacterium]
MFGRFPLWLLALRRLMVGSVWALVLMAASADTAPAQPMDCTTVVRVPVEECEALLAFYQQTNGSQWAQRSGWAQSNDVCTWYGVTCQDGHVVGLSLFDNHLSGSLPDALRHMSHLRYLNVSANRIGGRLPRALGYLYRLEVLDVSKNTFSGPLPRTLGNAQALQMLVVAGNPLEGTLPEELGRLTALTYLRVDNTNLVGPLTPALGLIEGLDVFWFAHTDLCVPRGPAFRAWLRGIDSVIGTTASCPLGATVTHRHTDPLAHPGSSR